MKAVLRIAAVLPASLLILVLGVGPYLATRWLTTRRFVFPDRENAGLTPASFGLSFEAVTLTSADGVRLSGWWVPAPEPRGSVVLVHGLNRSRIEMVRKLPFLIRRGTSALLVDLRHHGESGGERSSFGYFERMDVRAAVDAARRRTPGPVVAWGVSLGAASALLAAEEEPAIAGIVCDSTYRSLGDTVRHHLGLLRESRLWLRPLPATLLAAETTFWLGRHGGFDPDRIDLVRAATALSGRPALFVCNSEDRRMPSEIAFELRKAAGPRAQVLVVPGRSHGGAYREGTAAYEAAVGKLLDEVQGAWTEGRG